MTPADLDTLQALSDAATPGPWRCGKSVGRTIYDANDRLIGCMDSREDAAFTVAARRIIPALIAEIKRLAGASANCNGSCDIALARRQVGPDGVVPGNARECAEMWEQEAARLEMELRCAQIQVEDRGRSFQRVTAKLAEMTKARDEACYRWAQHRRDNSFDEDPHVEKLRAVGKEPA